MPNLNVNETNQHVWGGNPLTLIPNQYGGTNERAQGY